MPLLGSKKQLEIDKLLNENDELKNQLHSVLLKHGSYEDLEKNLIRSRKELAELNQKNEILTAGISELELTKADKEKHLGDLNSKILELEEIKDNLHRTIDAYSSQVSLLEERSKELDEKLERATDIEIKLGSALEKKERLEHDIADKEQTFAYLSTIEREIQAELEKERNELDSFKSQSVELNNELIVLNDNIQASQMHLTSMAQNEENITNRINNLNEEEIRKTGLLKSLENKIALNEEIKNNIDTSLNELVAQLNRNEKLYSEHSEKRELLQNDIIDLQKEQNDLQSKLTFAKEQFEVFQSEATKHTTFLAALGDEIRKIETMRDNLKEELIDLRSEQEKHSADISAKRELLNELETNRKLLEETNLQVEKDFGALIGKYILDFDNAKTNNDEQQTVLSENVKENHLLEKSISEKNVLLAELEVSLRLMQKENSFLQNHIAEAKKEKESLAESISLIRENIAKYSSQITSLKYEAESLQIKKSDLQRELSFLMTQISREYAEAESRLSAVNESISSGTAAYKELNSQITSAKEELKEYNPLIKESEPSVKNHDNPLENNSNNRNDADTQKDSGVFSIPEGMNDD